MRTTLTRLGIAAATATLALTAAVAPAAAADRDWDDDGRDNGQFYDDGGGRYHDDGREDGRFDGRDDGRYDDGRFHDRDDPRRYRGRVTADEGLRLRDAPNRGSRVIGFAPYGSIVSIYCKTSGQPIEGNPLWYLLTDGTWAWGAARYIDNIGPAPRWC